MTPELRIITREYGCKNIAVSIGKVVALDFENPTPGAEIKMRACGQRSTREECLSLESMQDLRELYQAIGDFLVHEDKNIRKGGDEHGE